MQFRNAGRPHNIAALVCGVNDFLATSDSALIYSYIVSIVGQLQTAGYDGVIVQTVTNASYANTSARTDLNTLIRDGAAMYGYVVSDAGADANIGCTNCYLNPTYYVDAGAHFTAAGNAIQTGYMKTALESLGVP